MIQSCKVSKLQSCKFAKLQLGYVRTDVRTDGRTYGRTGGLLELLSQLKRQCANETYLQGGVEKVSKVEN